jgi:hypothetical protein
MGARVSLEERDEVWLSGRSIGRRWDAQAARCRECHGRLRRLEGLALECGAGDLTATHSAKTRAIVVVPRFIFLGAKLTDRPGILPHESVVEYVQFADWN